MKRTLRQSRNTTKESELNTDGREQLGKLKNMAKQYEGKSESEIFSELQKAVTRGKADGTMDNAKINEIAGKISPMLNREQKGKLDELLKRLR